jgi:hypothetical protein
VPTLICDKAVKSNTNGKGQRILRFSVLFFASIAFVGTNAK